MIPYKLAVKRVKSRYPISACILVSRLKYLHTYEPWLFSEMIVIGAQFAFK